MINRLFSITIVFSNTYPDTPFCPIFVILFSSTYPDPPSFLMFFYFGEWARLASIKYRFARLSKGSIHLFLSQLPARWSDSPPSRVRDLTQPSIGLAIWSPNLASRLTDCPIINAKREVLRFFLRRPGCLRLHSAGPEETSRTLTWPCGRGLDRQKSQGAKAAWSFRPLAHTVSRVKSPRVVMKCPSTVERD